MKNKFLAENFQTPEKNSQFMKFEQGQNKFRILSNLVEGFVVFTQENKPVRKKIVRDEAGNIVRHSYFGKEELAAFNVKVKDGKPEDPKYFWLVLVYNHSKKAFQALEITQRTIINSMKEYLQQEDWSDPATYDFVVSKKGESLLTEYSVSTSLPKSLPEDALEELETLEYDLDAVFHNEYPL